MRTVRGGARQAAEATVNSAGGKAEEYEAALRDARNGIYREMEEMRRKWSEEHAARTEAAREKAQALVHRAQENLRGEVENAKRDLSASSQSMADEIVRTVLEGQTA